MVGILKTTDPSWNTQINILSTIKINIKTNQNKTNTQKNRKNLSQNPYQQSELDKRMFTPIRYAHPPL